MTIGSITVEGETYPVVRNEAVNRFDVQVQDAPAFMTYKQRGTVLSLVHTEVPAALRGKGIAGALIRTVLDWARTQHLTILPFCPAVASVIEKHPEYASLIDPSFGA